MANNNDGQIILGLDIPKTVSQINADIKKLQNQLAQVKATGALDTSATITQINSQIAKLQTQLNTINIKTNVDTKNIQNASQQIGNSVAQGVSEGVNKATKELNKIQLSMGADGKTTSQIEVLRNSFSKLGLSAEEVKGKMNGVDTELKELQSLMSSGASNSAIVAQFDRLQTALSQTQNNLKTTRSEYSLLATEQQRLSLANTIEAWNQKNTAATKAVRQENERYVITLRDLNTQMTRMQLGQINTAFKQTENSMRALNKLGASVINQLKQGAQSFTTWLSASAMVMALVTKIRQIPREVIAVNSAMIELTKVSNASENELKNYFDEAAKSAKDLGATISDVISATADFSRLGYNLPDASELAKVATLYKNVGDGIDIDTASSSIVSTMKAFGVEAENAIGIVDKFNEVGNNFAISSGEIGDALTRSASSLAVAGNSLSESIGLITAGNFIA